MIRKYISGIGLTIVLGAVATILSSLVPYHLISGSVFALLIGMALNPWIRVYGNFKGGIQFVSKQVLRLAIILMGLTLRFSQVFRVGSYSLFVMLFTLCTAFGGGYLLGKLLGIEWRLSSLISVGTGICGGSAIAAVAPVIEAQNKHIVYAISATFLFDVLMVFLFPLAGRYLQMSDIGYGLWTGTAVNDTSSVVAAGYAYSDLAGSYSVIVKLTRTLTIIPTVLLFSWIQKRESKKNGETSEQKRTKIGSMFPYFILFFLLMIALKSLNVISDAISDQVSHFSKFLMVMALGSIGLKTNFKEVCTAGLKPLLLGFLISLLVVIVSFQVQVMLNQI